MNADALAVELRLSLVQRELFDLAARLDGRRGEIVRHSARVLGLVGTVAPDGQGTMPANDNAAP